MPHIAMQEKPRATRAKPQATGSRDIPRSRAKTLKSGTRSKGTMVSRATMFRVSSSRATRSRVSRSRATHSRATHRQAIKHNPMVLLPPPLPSPPGCTPPPTPPHDYPHCHCRCHPLVSAKCARIAPLLGGSKLADLIHNLLHLHLCTAALAETWLVRLVWCSPASTKEARRRHGPRCADGRGSWPAG